MLRNIRLIYIHNLLTDIRFQSAFIVIYYAQVAGSYTAATAVLAIETLSAALFDIPTGIVSDKLGRKLTLTMGSTCFALSGTCYALAHGFGMLAAGATFYGLSYALFSGNNNALLFESLKAAGREKEFHHYQGRLSSMFQLGLGTSALIASMIAPHGLRIVFICGIVPQVLAAIVSLFITEPRAHFDSEQKSLAHMKAAFKTILHNRRLRLLTIGNSISFGVGEAVFVFAPAFINRLWPIWAVAIYRAMASFMGFIGFWFAGPILDRIKPARALALAASYGLVSELAATIMANVVSPVIFVSGSLLFGPYMVARDQIMQTEFTDQQRATLGSVVSFTASVVGSLSVLGLGMIGDHFGLRTAMFAGIIVGGLGVPIYVRLFRRYF